MQKELKQVIDELTAPGQMFELSQADVAGVTVKTWANAPSSLRDIWLLSTNHGDADYLVYQDERWTYREAAERVASIANWLTANGIGHQDKVAIAMRNYPEWMLAYWAITCVGAVSVGVNAWWVPEELEFGLKDSGTKMLICDSERLARFAEIRDSFPGLTTVAVRTPDAPEWAVPWSEVIAAEAVMPDANIDPEDDACIFYTSGTTGKPKGAQLTHRGCTNNVFSSMFNSLSQMTAHARVHAAESESSEPAEELQNAGIVSTPLFHVTANNVAAQTLTISGGKLVHMYKWDPAEALRIVEEEKITTFSGVPVMIREMISHPDFASRDTSSLKALGGGGAAVQPDLTEKVMTNENNKSMPAQGYGLTETCGIAAGSFGVFLADKPKSAGRLIPVLEGKCVDSDGNTLPDGEIGEICLKGPQIIKGYLNRPEATAETIVDGWLHTGDIGYFDEDNFIYLVDRAKDMVLRGGENVYCSEVEVVLFKHPEVAECVVFSVPDERLGEEVGAAIFPVEGKNASAESIREFCKSKLASFKIPRYIWILDEPLPRNASEKFLKRELQETLVIDDAY
jgi:steroid-24-oyl-CoA synthetase